MVVSGLVEPRDDMSQITCTSSGPGSGSTMLNAAGTAPPSQASGDLRDAVPVNWAGGEAQCLAGPSPALPDQLCGDGDRSLFGSPRAQVEPDRGAQPSQLLVGNPSSRNLRSRSSCVRLEPMAPT